MFVVKLPAPCCSVLFASSCVSRLVCVPLLLLAFASPSVRLQAAAQTPAASPAATSPAPPDPHFALPHGPILYLWPDGAPGAVGTEEQDKPILEYFAVTVPARTRR